MTNFVQSLFDGLRDRVRNPLVPSFIFAWLIVNWHQPFLLFLSKETAEDRVAAYSSLPVGSVLWYRFFAPLMLASIYVFGMPWAVLWIQRVLSKPEKLQRTEKTTFESELASMELTLARTRHEIAGLQSAAMFEDRLKALEDRVRQLSNASSEPVAIESGRSDDEETERENTRFHLESLGISQKTADELFDLGFRTRQNIKEMEFDTITNLESRIPAIREFVRRAGGITEPVIRSADDKAE